MNQLLGHNLVGKDLFIVGTRSDGTTGTCRIDGDGVLIDNGSLNIKPMDDNVSNKNGITLSPETNEGLMCTGYDENGIAKYRLKMNGQDGFNIYALDSNGNEKEELFHANIKGQLMTNGDIYCKRLFLQGMNGDIATAMDALKLNDKGNTAIGGNSIDAKGIQVKNGSKITFEVSEDGDVTGRNCVFRDGTFTGTFEAGSITSNTTIDVGTDIVVGANLTLGAKNENPVIHLNGMGQDVCTITGDVGGDKSTTIDSAGHLILKSVLGAYLNSVSDECKLVKMGDLRSILNRLDAIDGKGKTI